LRVAGRKSPLATGSHEEPRKEPWNDRQSHVLGNRETPDQAIQVPIFRNVGDACRQRCRRTPEAGPLAGEEDLARISAIQAEKDAGDFGATGADETGQANDLAGPDRKRYVSESADPRQASHIEKHVTDLRRAPGKQGHGPADHMAHEIGGREF
jgi:hypothetical protein